MPKNVEVKPAGMNLHEWIDRELEWIKLVKQHAGVGLTEAQMRVVETIETPLPDWHVMPGGLTRGPALALAEAVGVKLWGGQKGANCNGDDTPAIAGIQQWDLDQILAGRETGEPPWNLLRSAQMDWCRRHGDGPLLPVEIMFTLATYQHEHGRRPSMMDRFWL